MSNTETIKRKVLKLLQQKPETDSFEISIIIKEPIDDINKTLERMFIDDGTVLFL